MSGAKHLFRRTGYGCPRSPSGKHASIEHKKGALESKCVYCGRYLVRSNPRSKQWSVQENPFEAW